MIISHSKQICFWKIPRTGSSNAEMLIRLLAGLDLSQDVVARTHFYNKSANFDSMPDAADGTPGTRRAHITPTTAIQRNLLTQAQYDSYQNFCIVRDPVERFISTYHLAIPSYDFVPNDIIADIVQSNPNAAVWRKQSEWLAEGNITALPFSDYENSVNTILTAFGATPPPQLPNVSRSHWRHEVIAKQRATPQQAADVEAWYVEDMALNY